MNVATWRKSISKVYIYGAQGTTRIVWSTIWDTFFGFMYYSLFHSYSIKIAPTLKNNSVPKNERLNTSQVSNEAKQCTPLIYNEFYFFRYFVNFEVRKELIPILLLNYLGTKIHLRLSANAKKNYFVRRIYVRKKCIKLRKRLARDISFFALGYFSLNNDMYVCM